MAKVVPVKHRAERAKERKLCIVDSLQASNISSRMTRPTIEKSTRIRATSKQERRYTAIYTSSLSNVTSPPQFELLHLQIVHLQNHDSSLCPAAMERQNNAVNTGTSLHEPPPSRACEGGAKNKRPGPFKQSSHLFRKPPALATSCQMYSTVP